MPREDSEVVTVPLLAAPALPLPWEEKAGLAGLRTAPSSCLGLKEVQAEWSHSKAETLEAASLSQQHTWIQRSKREMDQKMLF